MIIQAYNCRNTYDTVRQVLRSGYSMLAYTCLPAELGVGMDPS